MFRYRIEISYYRGQDDLSPDVEIAVWHKYFLSSRDAQRWAKEMATKMINSYPKWRLIGISAILCSNHNS